VQTAGAQRGAGNGRGIHVIVGIESQRMGEKNDSLRGHSEREEICMEKKIRMEREK
jgi:hypothetical protein